MDNACHCHNSEGQMLCQWIYPNGLRCFALESNEIHHSTTLVHAHAFTCPPHTTPRRFDLTPEDHATVAECIRFKARHNGTEFELLKLAEKYERATRDVLF